MRHARIVESHAGRLIGATDVPLGSDGRSAGQALAARVPQWAPRDLLLQPDAAMPADGRGGAWAILPLRIDPDLREIDFGAVGESDVCRDRRRGCRRWSNAGRRSTPISPFPAEKAWRAFSGACDAAAERLARREAETVLVVTHGGVIRAMICHLLGLEPRQYVAFDVPMPRMAVIDLFDGRGRAGRPGTTRPAEAGHG